MGPSRGFLRFSGVSVRAWLALSNRLFFVGLAATVDRPEVKDARPNE